MKYSIPFVKKNDQGIIVENRDIRFTPGAKNLGKIVPAYYETDNQEEIEYIKNYPGMDDTYRLVEDKAEALKPVSRKKAKPAITYVNPVDEEDEEEFSFDDEEEEGEEGEEGEESSVTEIPGVNTIQKAKIKLMQMDKTIKPSDLKTLEDIQKYAEKLNINFPDLK
jgi:hypothetical protein